MELQPRRSYFSRNFDRLYDSVHALFQKQAVLYKYNTVITSSLVAAEVICTGLCFAFFLIE